MQWTAPDFATRLPAASLPGSNRLWIYRYPKNTDPVMNFAVTLRQHRPHYKHSGTASDEAGGGRAIAGHHRLALCIRWPGGCLH